MLAPSLALEKELCKRRIKVIEFLEQNYFDDKDNYTGWDHRFIRNWLADFPDVGNREALIESLEQASKLDQWMAACKKAVQ
jgi:hypothetical protein